MSNSFKKKVLLFSHEFPPFLGGVGTVAAQLAHYLSQENYEVHVMTRAQQGRKHVDGVVFHDVSVLPKLWFRSYWKALRAIGLDGFHTIILNEAAPTIVAGKYFDEATLGRCVVLVHGLEVERFYRSSVTNLPRKIFGFDRFHLRACLSARAVVAASQDMRLKFLSAIGREHRAKVQVVYLGVDPDAFYLTPSDYRQESGISADTFLIVSGSRLVEEKGYPEMLGAFKKLTDKVHNVAWVVCGDGAYRTVMQAQVEASHLSEHVRFEGDCTRDKLRWIYNDCDAYWLVSRYREAFPLSYIEAQLSGLPTLGRNLGGVPEAVTPGVTGWLVDDADEAVDILATYASRQRFARDAIADEAKTFSMSNTFKHFMDLLQ